MGNIIVKHYLNFRLKPHLIMGVLKYPLYVRVTYERKNHRFLSHWINYPISEKEFEKDKRINALIEYESNIIRDIIENGKEIENVNLNSRLFYSTRFVSECFLSYGLVIDDIKRQIYNYIIDKTELREKILSPYVSLDYIDFNGWIELANKKVFDKDSEVKVLFFSMLLEFEQKFYPDSSNEYEVSAILNFYEWLRNNGSKKFIVFANKKNLLSKNEIDKILKDFNNQLIEWSSFDMHG